MLPVKFSIFVRCFVVCLYVIDWQTCTWLTQFLFHCSQRNGTRSRVYGTRIILWEAPLRYSSRRQEPPWLGSMRRHLNMSVMNRTVVLVLCASVYQHAGMRITFVCDSDNTNSVCTSTWFPHQLGSCKLGTSPVVQGLKSLTVFVHRRTSVHRLKPRALAIPAV